MSGTASLLAELPARAFGLVLVFSRIGAAAMMLPGIGEPELPRNVRLGFTLGCTLLLLPAVSPLLPPLPASGWAVAGMVVAEIATGLWLGWMPRLLVQTLPVAGQFVASAIGLASVLQPDPRLGPETTALSRLFSLGAPTLLFASGLYALPLAALAGSYHLVPAGALLPPADSARAATLAVAEAFSLSLRLAAPFLLAGLLWQGGLGLLARLVPNLQVFAASLPGQILLGLVLLALLGAGMFAAWHDQVRAAFSRLPGV